MAEYIDRNALIEALDAAEKRQGMGMIVAQTLKQYVKRVPAADVAPVVRCKECKYSYKSWLSDMTGEIWCTFWQKTQGKAWIMMHFDDFCSHGAKMDLEESK